MKMAIDTPLLVVACRVEFLGLLKFPDKISKLTGNDVEVLTSNPLLQSPKVVVSVDIILIATPSAA